MLKDIVNRHKLLSGYAASIHFVTPRYRVEYKPGWDCHGLPIELKALQSIASNDNAINAIDVRQLSRRFASDTIKKQKKSISQWGIMCDISCDTSLYRSFTSPGRQGEDGVLLHVHEGVRDQRAE